MQGNWPIKPIPFCLITNSALTTTSGFQNAKDWPMPGQSGIFFLGSDNWQIAIAIWQKSTAKWVGEF